MATRFNDCSALRPCLCLGLALAPVACSGPSIDVGNNAPADAGPDGLAAQCPANGVDLSALSVVGTAPTGKCDLVFDPQTTCNGAPSVSVSSTENLADFCGVAYGLALAPVVGKRVRLTGWVRSSDVLSWAGLWMRVDGPGEATLAFDNMQSRPIVGTTDWKAYQIVLDVADTAVDVVYGVQLGYDGTVWLDGVSVEVVDDSVPTTGS